MEFIFFIPLIDAFLFGAIVFAGVCLAIRELKRKIEDPALDIEFEELIDERLDQVIDVVSQQIPMASMLLSDLLVNKIKSQTKQEMLKMTPKIKQKVLLHFSLQKKASRVIIYGAMTGFLFGLFHAITILLAQSSG